MNIFILSENPKECAEFHCDKHVVKMIVETAQLLSTAWRELGEEKFWMYKSTHRNHPCSLWARESRGNMRWLTHLGYCLCKEYEHRYGKRHSCADMFHSFTYQLSFLPTKLPEERTPWRLAMPDDCKIDGDGVRSYQNYYLKHKQHLWSWKNRPTPDFILNSTES